MQHTSSRARVIAQRMMVVSLLGLCLSAATVFAYSLNRRFEAIRFCFVLVMLMGASARAQSILESVWWRWIQPSTAWGPIYSIDFSPDGNLIATGTSSNGNVNSGAIAIQRVRDGSLVHGWTAHAGPVRSVTFSPDGTLLASCSADRTVKLWRVSDRALIHTMTGHTNYVNVVVFSPDGQTLLSGSGDQTVKFWRVSDGTLLRQISAGTHVGAIAISPDGEEFATGGGRGDNYYHNHLLASSPTLWGASISVWRFADGQHLRSMVVNSVCTANTVHSLRYSRDGRYLGASNYQNSFCGRYDASLKIYSATDGALLYTLNIGGYGYWTTCFDLAPDARAYAATDNVDTTVLRSFPSNASVWRAPSHTGYTSRMSVRFSPHGRYLAATYGQATGTLLELMRNPLWTPGDVNGDGCVDDNDLADVIFSFGTERGLSDLSENGIVDDADLLIVLFNFGSGC